MSNANDIYSCHEAIQVPKLLYSPLCERITYVRTIIKSMQWKFWWSTKYSVLMEKVRYYANEYC